MTTKEILKQLNIDEKFLPVKTVLNEISHAKDKMETFTEHSGQEVYNHMPFKFNYKGRLKEYLKECGADTTNLHIIN